MISSCHQFFSLYCDHGGIAMIFTLNAILLSNTKLMLVFATQALAGTCIDGLESFGVFLFNHRCVCRSPLAPHFEICRMGKGQMDSGLMATSGRNHAAPHKLDPPPTRSLCQTHARSIYVSLKKQRFKSVSC